MNDGKAGRRNFLLKLGALAGAISTGLISPAVFPAAAKGKLAGAKLSGKSGKLSIALSLNTPVQYKVFTLPSPDRVVIDLQDTRLSGKLKQGAHDRPPLTAIRYAEREDGRLRIVLDMDQEVKVKSSMQGSTLNLDITPTGRGSTGKAAKSDSSKKSSKTEKSKTREASPSRDSSPRFIVAIDPGHGGRDPGAIGPSGTREKDVVLEIARKLKARIDGEPGMRAVMTRSSDKFIPLRERMDIAHKNKADLFISVHADANPNARINGSTVYILSETGASSEAARLIAESENSYDVKFGNRSLSNTNSKIASILLDLSQNAMMDRSLNLAKGVLNELSKVNNPLRPRVESARFVVLRSPDIPSMLVETAFISNPQEEKRLRTAQYQQQLARAVFQGVKRYQIAYASGGSGREA